MHAASEPDEQSAGARRPIVARAPASIAHSDDRSGFDRYARAPAGSGDAARRWRDATSRAPREIAVTAPPKAAAPDCPDARRAAPTARADGSRARRANRGVAP